MSAITTLQTRRSWLTLCAIIALACHVRTTSAQTSRGGSRGMCGPPPPPKPQRIAGGESAKPPGRGVPNAVPKLPCAPTRRTEKKMPPAPPTLVAKLSHGSNQDWTTDRNDIFNLLKIVGREYETPFRAIVVEFGSYSFNAKQTPIVYMSGHNSFSLDGSKKRELRQFIESGGTLIIDACCGSAKFASSAKSEVRGMFPDRRFKRLPLDHPVFSCHNIIEKVAYSGVTDDFPGDEPYLEGVDFGCRTAVFFSPFDLSCGWDNHAHEHGKRVAVRDAVNLGVNMLSYALVNREQGEVLARTRAYTDIDSQTRGKVVLAQVRYDGEWNRHVAATANLLSDLDKNFPADVKYARADVALSDPEIFSYPVLYLTGHDDFELSGSELANLRKFLQGGGTLLAESCCGRQSFDTAFRREIGRVLPKSKLETLAASHPVFNICYDLTDIGITGRLKERHRGQQSPVIDGLSLNGTTSVIYSRYSLSCGWEVEDCKYCLGYDSPTAIQLGVNALGYALSH